MKCGNKHPAKECTPLKTSPPHCANCNEEHTANYKGCAYYKSKVQPERKPKTAVERLTEVQVTSANLQVGKLSSSYAEKARACILQARKPQTRNLQSQENKENEKILEMLKRVEESQIVTNEKIQSIEARITAMKNAILIPPPRERNNSYERHRKSQNSLLEC